MLNFCDFIVTDFETTGVGPGKQPCEIASVIIDARRLEIKPQGIFTSLCRIIPDEEVSDYGLDKLDPKALEVNGLKLTDVQNAPPLKKIWQDYENFVLYHNPTKNRYNNPIFVAHNKQFDKELVDNIKLGLHRGKNILPYKILSKAAQKKMTDGELADVYRDLTPLKEPWKFSSKHIFNPTYEIDTLQSAFEWFENTKNPHNLNQVALREFMQFPIDDAHGALNDVLYTAEMLIRYLTIQRKVTPEVDFNTDGKTLIPIKDIMKEYGR